MMVERWERREEGDRCSGVTVVWRVGDLSLSLSLSSLWKSLNGLTISPRGILQDNKGSDERNIISLIC